MEDMRLMEAGGTAKMLAVSGLDNVFLVPNSLN
jgi:hypothetical protein